MSNYIKCNCCIRFRTMFNYNFRLYEFIFYFFGQFGNNREEGKTERKGNNAHSKLINNCSNAWQTFVPFVRGVFNIQSNV